MDTIALFGGSFDPPHVGHEAIVKELQNLNYIDKIIVMPTFLNPFKTEFTAPAELRLQWLECIFLNDKDVLVDGYEVSLGKKVPTMQTVNHLLQSYDKIFLVIGADNLRNLREWFHFKELQKKVTFIVASRENIEVPKTFISLRVKEDISSSTLRKNIDEKKIPQKCAKEIAQHYKEKNEQ